MDGARSAGPPLGRAPVAAVQLERIARFVCAQRGGGRVNLLAHSWGTIPAAMLAIDSPEFVERLVFFAPIVRRVGSARADGPSLGAWYPLSIEARRQRFVQDMLAGHPPVLLDRHFQRWANSYLDCEPQPAVKGTQAVRIPAGPAVDILAAWGGEFPYDPARIRAPLCIVRGEWDSLCTDTDACWLWDALVRSPLKREVKLSKGTHLMHLEEGRYALYRGTLAFFGDADSLSAGAF
jgi:pimeloyl-ACP methyl ester carboxylesterase